MKNYLYLQFKRTLRYFPFVLAVSFVLLLGLALIFSSILKSDSQSEDRNRFKIGVAGETDDTYLELGITALESFDSSRFAIEFIHTTEDAARSALQRGDLSAYIVIPEGFAESALYGEIISIKYVTTPGSIGLVSIFKDEIAKAVSDILSESQKGIYGLYDSLKYNTSGVSEEKHMNNLALEYVDFILDRSGLYEVNELGIADGISLPQYYFCGITVLFLLLMGLPHAPLFVKKDHSLRRVLSANSYPASKQVFCEYAAYFCAMLALMLLAFSMVGIFSTRLSDTSGAAFLSGISMLPLILRSVPVIAAICALTFLLFELSENLVSGILLNFFASIALCYVSGCLYPIHTLPLTLQKLSGFLPTGISRSYLSGCFSDTHSISGLIALTAYSALLLLLITFVRKHRISKKRGG